MASIQQPMHLTKKQKKATAFRDRCRKDKGEGKGKGKGKTHLTLGHPPPRPHSTENNVDEGAFDAVPAMEDQALAEVASAAEGDEEGDEVPKAAVGTRPSKRTEKVKVNKRRRSDEDADVDADAGSAAARPPPKKKVRFARGSDGAPLVAHEEEDGATSIGMEKKSDDGGGGHDAEKRTNKGSKQRYILFIGTFAASLLLLLVYNTDSGVQ
jgi:hypothetical protein